MTPECIHCLLLYTLMSVCGMVWANRFHGEERNSIQDKYMAKNHFLPTFLTTPANITVHKGDEAILPCAIEHRRTRTVVWRMIPNPNPLTIDDKTFVSDTRFKVVNPKHSLEWNLHIENAQPEDSGVYECQVSAVTRNIRQHMWLTVRNTPGHKRRKQGSRHSKSSRPSSSSSSSGSSSSQITIKGSSYVERGDTLKLQCNASGSEYHPDEIDWFKDGDKIKNSERITLEKHVSLNDRTITSSLHIKRGHMNDAGTYVCRTSDLQVTSVKVNVLNTWSNNEKRESLESAKGSHQKNDPENNASSILSSRSSLLAGLLVLVFIMISSSRVLS